MSSGRGGPNWANTAGSSVSNGVVFSPQLQKVSTRNPGIPV